MAGPQPPGPSRVESIHIDGAVALFATGVMLLAGLVAGLVPALASGERQILSTLHDSARSHSGGRGGVRLRRVLLALQVGLTTVLLVVAGLLVVSYRHLRTADIGCATHNVLTMRINLPKGKYNKPEQIAAFYEQFLERVRALPGVDAAGLTSVFPGEGRGRDDTFGVREHAPQPRGENLDATTRFVDPGYFSALRIPLLQGRFFRPDERLDKVRAILVNREFTREVFPGEESLGKHIVGGPGDGSRDYEIVGVVGDTLDEVSGSPYPAIFYPLSVGLERDAALVVRVPAGHDPSQLTLPVLSQLASLDPDLPVTHLLTMDEFLGTTTIDASFDATLLLAFAAVSLALAGVGLFGVVSFIVAQRTAEIGIRIALGARREQVMGMVLGDGLRPAVFGLGLGLAASAGLTRMIQSMLYGTRPLDPSIYVLVCATLLVVAMAACAAPAWQASRLEPMTALRME